MQITRNQKRVKMWKDLEILVQLENNMKEILSMGMRKRDFVKMFLERSKVQEREFNV